MATTVIYKDNTLTTLGNGDTKTLKTAGTYLEDDIEINENLNLQSKIVTPTTSQQIVTADSYGTVTRAENTHYNTSSTSSTAQLTISPATLSQYKYLRYNGTAHIYDSNNYLYWTIVFNNLVIGPINSPTVGTVAVDSSGYSVTKHNGSQDFTNVSFNANYQSPWNYFYLGFSYDPEKSGNPTSQFSGYFTFENFTVDYSNGNTWQNYEALEQVTVGAIPSNYVIPTGTKTITSNGTGIDVAAYATVDVNVAGAATPSYQSKSVTPTESSQTVTADSGYDALSSVTVGAISSTYVGSGITRRTSSNLTASGATVTVPAGYYESQATKSVTTTTHPNPTVSVNSSTGLITASHTQTAGYVSAGTTTGTSQLSVQAATTITPTTSSQTAVAAGKYTTGAVTVGPIPSNYVDSATLRTYRSGTSAPASSLGNNGDIYLQLAQ